MFVPRRKADLEAERKRAKKAGGGYPIRRPAKDPVVEFVDKQVKEEKKHPAQRRRG